MEHATNPIVKQMVTTILLTLVLISENKLPEGWYGEAGDCCCPFYSSSLRGTAGTVEAHKQEESF